jgi:hypothetical protein
MKPAGLRHWFVLLALMAGLLVLVPFTSQVAAREIVDLELVLAVDVSGSVDGEEYALLMGGIAQAFRNPEVIRVIETITPRGIAVVVVLWSSSEWQSVAVNWTHVRTKTDAWTFAAAVTKAPRESTGNTAIASAIDFAERELESNEYEGARQVIDVSGDGISNDGPDTAPARDRAVERGITINGLVIVENNLPAKSFYRRKVIGGPGAFAMDAHGFADFGRVFLRKLLRELSGAGIS